jgi:hypothetical protein
MPGSLDEIIVTAPIIRSDFFDSPLSSFFWETWLNLAFNERTNEFAAGPYNLNIEDITGNLSQAQTNLKNGAIRTFQIRYSQLRTQIGAIPDNAVINLSSFSSITGAELKAKFDSLATLQVTDRSYKPGYTGANHQTSWEISYNSLAGWNAAGQDSTYLLILHEIAHNTDVGRANHDQNWNAHRNENPGASPDQLYNTFVDGNARFINQEMTANTIARNIANAIGVQVEPNPTYGYLPNL